MSEPDAMDLERIGRAFAREFSDYDPEWGVTLSSFLCEWRGSSRMVTEHPCPGRRDTERLIAVLERLGFKITKEEIQCD